MPQDVLELDGAQGEGGGQILRTALCLSLVTGRAFRLRAIRARRRRPGLLAQHLTAVRAAAAVGRARVEGARLGARELVFEPHDVRPGRYEFPVGTAGSAILVAQTVLPALALARGPSVVRVEGGTHAPMAPPFEFLAASFLPLLERAGPRVRARLERHGFHPHGGGRIEVGIQPVERLAPLRLVSRGALRRARAVAKVARLPRHVAERELGVLAAKLEGAIEGFETMLEDVRDGSGPGNVLLAILEFEHVTAVHCAFGAPGLPAERVAARLVRDVRRYLRAGDAPACEHLADQLLIPMALAGAGELVTLRPSTHTTTNAALIERFLPVRFEMRELGPDRWAIAATGATNEQLPLA